MPLLIDSDTITGRRAVAAGGLAPLAESLAADLERALGAGIRDHPQKEVLSRAGGTCEPDG